MVQIMAHRGSSGTHPENTLPAFAEAVRVGADGIELDVHVSKDQQLIVMHDEDVARTTNGKGLIREMTLAELKELNAGTWFDKSFSATKIPTLQEVLHLLLVKNFRGLVIIEIKTDKFHYPNIERLATQALAEEEWPFRHSYCSFNLDSLKILHYLEREVPLAYVTGHSQETIEWGLQVPYLEGIHPKLTWYRQQAQTTIWEKSIRPWLVNQEEDIRFCLERQVTGIITDFPERALDVRGKVTSSKQERRKEVQE